MPARPGQSRQVRNLKRRRRNHVELQVSGKGVYQSCEEILPHPPFRYKSSRLKSLQAQIKPGLTRLVESAAEGLQLSA